MCIAAGNAKPNLRSFVLCSGIQYGNGEEVFYEHFKVKNSKTFAQLKQNY